MTTRSESVSVIIEAGTLRSIHLSREIAAFVEHFESQLPAVCTHCRVTAIFAARFADHLRLNQDDHRLLVASAFLHDIGKIFVPYTILHKRSALTDPEREIIRRHAEIGHSCLAADPHYSRIARIVGQHHERFDGSGYPNGIFGNDIDPLARALSVVDAFAALTEDRPYHKAVEPEEALAEIAAFSGSQFDPHYVREFMHIDHSAPRLEEVNSIITVAA